MLLIKITNRHRLELEDDVRCVLSETYGMDKLLKNKQY